MEHAFYAGSAIDSNPKTTYQKYLYTNTLSGVDFLLFPVFDHDCT